MQLHQCPCCGTRFVQRRVGGTCDGCGMHLAIGGEIFANPSYIHTETGWIWFDESGQRKSWKDGPKVEAQPRAKNRTPRWMESYSSLTDLK